MIVIATGFIPLRQLSIISTMVMWESNQRLGKNIAWLCGKATRGLERILRRVLVKRILGNHGYVHWLLRYN